MSTSGCRYVVYIIVIKTNRDESMQIADLASRTSLVLVLVVEARSLGPGCQSRRETSHLVP